jgi:hypothetical protein
LVGGGVSGRSKLYGCCNTKFTVYGTKTTTKQTNFVALVSKRTVPTDRVSAKLVPTFADRGCGVVSTTDPHGR